MNTATGVDSFGLMPAWTPNQPSNILGGLFSRVSNPWYYNVKWDGKQFVIDKKLLNVAEELEGQQGLPAAHRVSHAPPRPRARSVDAS